MEADKEYYFSTALNLTKQAGELIKLQIGKQSTEAKSCEIDLVTETDQAVEKLLMDGLLSEFPTHKFIGEETVSSGGKCELTDDPTWIIDPIDGTMNFVHAFPHCCISIALFINKEPTIAIIYNPSLEQLFTAKSGNGAFLNGKQIKVSNETDIKKALLMMEVGTSRDAERLNALFENQQTLIPKVRGIRTLGSAALNMAMVALGCADAYFEFGIHIWDIAAGELLVKEAGGVIMDPTGASLDRMSRRVLCAGTEALAKELSKNITQYYPQPTD